MATITLAEVLFDREQEDGRRCIKASFTAVANDAVTTKLIEVGPRFVPASFDANAWLSAHSVRVLDLLQERDARSGKNVHSGMDPLSHSESPLWAITKRVRKAYIYWMMNEPDPRIVLYLEPLLNYLFATYDNNQLSTRLDITIPRVVRMKERTGAILSDTGTCKSLINDFDVLQEEF